LAGIKGNQRPRRQRPEPVQSRSNRGPHC
jgi:hypothetical protein